MYTYFISYAEGTGFGNCTFTCNNKINDETISEIQNQLLDFLGKENIVILFYKRIYWWNKF